MGKKNIATVPGFFVGFRRFEEVKEKREKKCEWKGGKGKLAERMWSNLDE